MLFSPPSLNGAPIMQKFTQNNLYFNKQKWKANPSYLKQTFNTMGSKRKVPKLPSYEGNYQAEDLEKWLLKSNDEHGTPIIFLSVVALHG